MADKPAARKIRIAVTNGRQTRWLMIEAASKEAATIIARSRACLMGGGCWRMAMSTAEMRARYG